jgi:hypothetical protein
MVAIRGPEAGSGLDLDAHELPFRFDHRVITRRLAPRLENLEVAFGGGGDKL